MSTSVFDSESGLTKSSTSTSATGVSTAASYVIEKQSDNGGVKTYKYYPLGSTAYWVYKIQEGRTLETRYFNADALISTTTYTLSDNNVIRSKLGNYTLSNTSYSSPSSAIKSSFQTVDVLSDTNSKLVIRVKTFNDGVLASQTDTLYEKNPNKIDPNEKAVIDHYKKISEWEYERYKQFPSNSDFVYAYAFYYNSGSSSDPHWIWDFRGYKEITTLSPIGVGIIRYKGKASNVIIPEQIEGLPVVIIGEVAFINCFKLTSVIIPDTVVRIGSEAYAINGVTGDKSFQNCFKLNSVTLPDMFSNHRALPYNVWTFDLFRGSTFIDQNNTSSLSMEYHVFDYYEYGIREFIGVNPGTYTREIGTSTWTKK